MHQFLFSIANNTWFFFLLLLMLFLLLLMLLMLMLILLILLLFNSILVERFETCQHRDTPWHCAHQGVVDVRLWVCRGLRSFFVLKMAIEVLTSVLTFFGDWSKIIHYSLTHPYGSNAPGASLYECNASVSFIFIWCIHAHLIHP